MDVVATAPERTTGLPQRRLSSKHLIRNGIKTTSKRWTAVEVRVGRGNYEQAVGVTLSWGRNKAFNYRKFPRFVCHGDEEEEAFVVVVYS